MHTKIEEAIGENKNVWNELHDLGLLPSPRAELHGFTTEEINSYFASISISPNEEYSNAHNVMIPPAQTDFSLNLWQLTMLSWRCHILSIPQSIIAKALLSITPQLVCLFNESISQGIFSNAWKKEQIIALEKDAVPSSPSDFRSIFLLCFLWKLLEKLAQVLFRMK